jgi:membrane protease YdiL (CAAX protease family)
MSSGYRGSRRSHLVLATVGSYRRSKPMLTACLFLSLLLSTTPAAAQVDAYARADSAQATVRAAAATELARDPNPRAVQTLIRLLTRDSSEEVRHSAVLAIEDRGDPGLAPLLRAVGGADPSPTVRTVAAASAIRLAALGKKPRVAAGLGILCPGCGHLYLQQHHPGFAYLGTTGALLVLGASLLANDSTSTRENPAEPLAIPLVFAAQNLWFYAAFDAYRDVRRLRGERGARVPITDESLVDLATAPFRPRVLSSRWVWGVVPVSVGLAVGLSYLVEPGSFGSGRPSIFEVDRVRFLGRDLSRSCGFALGELYYGSVFVPVAVGEEAFFRGFVQSELTEAYGPWPGLVVGSLIFGAVHVLNFLGPEGDASDALFAVPFITAVGSTLGLAYMKTDWRLETSVAMHFWYNFLLSTVAFVVDPTNQPFTVRVTLPF